MEIIKKMLRFFKYRFPVWVDSVSNLVPDIFNLFFRSDKCLVIDVFARQRFGSLVKFNWGDDINYNFFKEITGKKIIIYRTSFIAKLLAKDKYCLIGSIIGINVDEKTTVWGSGMNINFDFNLLKQPKRICAIRGPITRNLLIEHGISCPDVYGDPALLLPYIYKPIKIKQYKVGIIPHFVEREEAFIKGITNPEILVINLERYDKWTDIIDQICSCEKIVSSSLHGIIVADAYGIPNAFAKFGNLNSSYNYFKYRDYFASVEREFIQPPTIKTMAEFQYTVSRLSNYREIKFDPTQLIKVCPFPIKIKINEKY